MLVAEIFWFKSLNHTVSQIVSITTPNTLQEWVLNSDVGHAVRLAGITQWLIETLQMQIQILTAPIDANIASN